MAELAIGLLRVSNCLIAPTRTRRLLNLGLSLTEASPRTLTITSMAALRE